MDFGKIWNWGFNRGRIEWLGLVLIVDNSHGA